MTTTQEIEVNAQILFDRPNTMIVCRITEIREKAVKVDYAVEPVYFAYNPIVVFSYSCWIPKSVIIEDKGLTVKKWFAANFKGGFHIKKYYVENDKKIFV